MHKSSKTSAIKQENARVMPQNSITLGYRRTILCLLGLLHRLILNDANVAVARHSGSGRDQFTDDNIFLQADQMVDLTLDRSLHWYELFPEGDGRRLLTWKGRFANVTNVVNFYSTQEEVVNNGDGAAHSITERNCVWYNQEMRKGNWTMMLHANEGGWAFNGHYDTSTNYWIGNNLQTEAYHLTPEQAKALADGALKTKPFFQDFSNEEMYLSTNGVIVATNYLYRAEMLAYAIPSESYAVGANPLPGLDVIVDISASMEGNYNMAELFLSGIDDLPHNGDKPKKMYRNWQHSTFVQRSYKRTCQLYKVITRLMKE